MVSFNRWPIDLNGLHPTFQGCIFSMIGRYSLRVVAPTNWVSPRAKAGLRSFPASILPSPAGSCANTYGFRRWTESPSSRWRISSINSCMRSSNWHGCLCPERGWTWRSGGWLFLGNLCGTSPSTIFWARPSTTAVFRPQALQSEPIVLGSTVEDSMTRIPSPRHGQWQGHPFAGNFCEIDAELF